jgi:alkylhydroperoxidase/carboxymuconolactone decarboxylase family protein YurZ
VPDDERRRKGLEHLVGVYGHDLGFPERLENLTPEIEPYTVETLEHLFGDIWSRPGLSVRDRRLLVLGVTAAHGRGDLAETQIVGALRNEELTREELGEIVLQLAFYAGWPCAQAISRAAASAVARVAEEQAQAQ